MKTLPKLLTFVALALAVACSADGGPGEDCVGEKCDEIPDSEVEDTVCDGIVQDRSGARNQKVAGRLNDPFAQLVMRTGDSCPTTFQDIMAKLRETDTEGCDPSNPRAGIVTRAVSETAQIEGKATSYRLVTSRTCNDRPKHGMLFSLFGVRAGGNIPPNVEVIAFDEGAGVFNYYETDGRGINFFGNSNDFLDGPGAGDDQRCAQCHTGGGLVMKELHTPWLHWEGHMDTPGAKELIDAHEDLGTKASGSEFEGLVKTANRTYNEKRIDHVMENGTLQDVLRPLFCTVEVNLDNGADFESPPEGGPGGSEVSLVPFDAVLDPQLKRFGGVIIEFADYDALIKANGQFVPGVDGAVDTVFDMAFIERAEADKDYVEKLIERGIIDEEFAKDVLMVDFTRPIFSNDRCDLLSTLPDLPSDQRTAARIKETVLGGLTSTSPATTDLRKNLEQDNTDHAGAVEAFIKTCEALESADFLANAMAYISLNRRLAGDLHVFEFPQTMPRDNQNVPVGTRLHPTSCELTTGYVNVELGQTGGESGN